MDRAIFYIFVLSLVLVALAYYTGLQTDANSLSAGLQSLIYSATGRNSSGNFAGYPKAA